MTYLSFLLVVAAWIFIFRTRPGLMLRGIGERPAAAYVRGANVNRLRYLYTVAGGAIAGLAGPIYSLSVKAGWKGTISGLDGIGWIVLAITIFGGWNPFRAAFGAYLFSLLQWLGLVLQPALPGVPSQVLQVAPFPAHDPHAAVRQHRQRGMGGALARASSRAGEAPGRPGAEGAERHAPRRPGHPVREGIAPHGYPDLTPGPVRRLGSLKGREAVAWSMCAWGRRG